MFKFNFNQPEKKIPCNSPADDTIQEEISKLQSEEKPLTRAQFEEIKPKFNELSATSEKSENVKFITFSGGQIFSCFEDDENNFIEHSCEQVQDGKNQKNSDLIPGIYEGGAKIWECTQDLGDFLTDNENVHLNSFKDKLILDLGCGAGILGILALSAGALVHFHDYNKNVISKTTIKHVAANCPTNLNTNNISEYCHFYSGDWINYISATKDNPKFDIILTSETIYNPINYQNLIDVFKCRLKSNGIVYLAAKVYYFGVGGSLREFERHLKMDGTFQSTVVWKCLENVGREILKIEYKSDIKSS